MPENAPVSQPCRDYRHIRVRPLGGALGAEIAGVDPGADLDAEVVAEIRAAWLRHLVVVFRDVDLPPPAFMAFARRLAEPAEYPMLRGLPGFPCIVEVIKRAHERHNFGGVWHSDTAYLDEPPIGALLLAREVPEYGGDTLFANMYLAYERLSQRLREVLGTLRAVNTSAKAQVSRTRAAAIASQGGAPTPLSATHPVVRTHSETGRRLLYVNPAHTVRFEGMSERESAPLLEYLFAHQTRAAFTCRVRWRPGSLALWDNRACLHLPLNDYQGRRRAMQRISLGRERPG